MAKISALKRKQCYFTREANILFAKRWFAEVVLIIEIKKNEIKSSEQNKPLLLLLLFGREKIVFILRIIVAVYTNIYIRSSYQRYFIDLFAVFEGITLVSIYIFDSVASI